MRQITSIESQAKAGSRRLNVFLDGKFAFSLSEEVAAGLSPGSFLSAPEIADLQRRDSLRAIYDAAALLLSYRPRSVAEVRSRLLRRAFDPSLVEEVLERLQQQRFLGDQDFAQFWVENRQSHSPRGNRLLHAELCSKGVEREVIEEALPEPEDEEAGAYRLARRKARLLRGLDWQEFRRRMGDYLVRRGFDYETAATTVRRVWDEVHDPSSGESEADGDTDLLLR